MIVSVQEKGSDLTKGSAAAGIMLVKIVLQGVPAPPDAHHHMGTEDLRRGTQSWIKHTSASGTAP